MRRLSLGMPPTADANAAVATTSRIISLIMNELLIFALPFGAKTSGSADLTGKYYVISGDTTMRSSELALAHDPMWLRGPHELGSMQ
jgi:hypothetical protein